MTMQPSTNLPAAGAPAAPPQPGQVPASAFSTALLPSRQVREDTIEDAYVRFILCCNPAVPSDTDATALRDAFRVPPKSEGKTFNTFRLYQLIGQLMQKDEVKTWGDLALRLGVEPPNHEKNQSTQKIQQYAVRLKRWMKSMHIDAFFDYLYETPHVYWTRIPHPATPIEEIARDGVAPEDDMALRALLPHIRPRRGRRTREDDEAGRSSSSKMSRLESPLAGDCAGNGRPDALEPWTAHPGGLEGRNTTPQGLSTPVSNRPWALDAPQSQFTPHPQSAITPSTRTDFWADEPKSAMAPNRANRGHKRHGPKVVSSAWRSGQASSGKTRGRPPINRASVDRSAPSTAYPVDGPTVPAFRPSPPETAMSATPTPGWGAGGGGDSTMSVVDVLLPLQQKSQLQPQARYPTPPALPSLNAALSFHDQQSPLQSERLLRPRGLSLQVPKRVGGEVRLATPPPVVMVNGQAAAITNSKEQIPSLPAEPCGDDPPRARAPVAVAQAGDPAPVDHVKRSPPPDSGVPNPLPSMPDELGSKQRVFFRDSSDRTNIEALEGFFMHEIMTGNWIDKDGNELPCAGADEAYAIVSTVIDTLQKEAPNDKAFLLNVSALAGGKLLMTTTSLKITVANVLEDRTEYFCEWQLQLGDCKGLYNMKEVVEHVKWRLPPARLGVAASRDAGVAAAALATTPPLPPPAPTEASGEAFSDHTGADTGTSTTRASGTHADGSSAVNEHAHVSHRTRAPALAAEESVEYWKARCCVLTEMLDTQRNIKHPADHWKNRYIELAELYKRKDQEMARMQARVMDALRDPRLDRV